MQATHSFRAGLIFISIAVFFWGILPVALKLTTAFIDAVSLTWIRFLFATILIFIYQWYQGKLAQFLMLSARQWFILLIAGLFLILNYVSFVWSLEYLGPGEAQLNFQTAPFFLAFGGYLLFKEKLHSRQIIFFILLAMGLLLFFHDRLLSSDFSRIKLPGVLIIQLSAMSWCIYALFQKWLNRVLSPNNILMFIFALGSVVLLPFISLQNLPEFSTTQNLIILFCSINTIIAYGSFAQSLEYWRTVEVSAMVAVTPIVSFATTTLFAAMGWWHDIILMPKVDWLSMFGIILVVLSAAGVQIWGKTKLTAPLSQKQ